MFDNDIAGSLTSHLYQTVLYRKCKFFFRLSTNYKNLYVAKQRTMSYLEGSSGALFSSFDEEDSKRALCSAGILLILYNI